MDSLLFLVHRIPFPPNKGDKIRSFNLLKHLAKGFDVYLGTFIDDPADRENVEPLREFCSEISTFELKPTKRKIASVKGLLHGQPLTIPYYAKPQLHGWVRDVVKANEITDALVFSSSMAQYIDFPMYANMTRVIDFVDIDSEKWKAYAERKSWPASSIYAREARTLFKYEMEIARRFDHCLFVSQAEAELFERLTGIIDGKIGALHNGVDIDYFDPRCEFVDPYPRRVPVLVFTGAMDYWANVDAVCWFAEEAFSAIRSAVPDAEFWIVGSQPSEAVKDLQNLEGVHVTGAVPDVRPFIQYARAAVAPLRVARGIQNKVLEAMAMGKPVLTTPQAIEGINVGPEYEPLITEKIPEMVDIGRTLLKSDHYNSLGVVGRAYVEGQHDWTSQLKKIDTLFTKGTLKT